MRPWARSTTLGVPSDGRSTRPFPFGSKVTSWEYRNITGIQLETRMNRCSLVIRTAGEESVDPSYWATGKGSAQQAPNAILFSGKRSKDVQAFVARLRQLVTDARTPAQQASAAVESQSIS